METLNTIYSEGNESGETDNEKEAVSDPNGSSLKEMAVADTAIEASKVDGTTDESGNESSPEPDPEAADPASSTNDNNGVSQHDNKDIDVDDDEVPTYKQLCCAYFTCCGCVRGDDRTRSEKAWSSFYWFAWWILVGFSLYLALVNIGSTTQQENARAKLPFVHEAIYDYMDEGPVCAFDNKGADSNITTFADKDAAHAAGFLILHCGACAACSDWHNLRQEYATRNYLAEESAKCAKKALFGGRQAVLDCLKLPPVDFQGKCAECWADDILCTKDFCAFIFLQSTVINTISDFQVGPNSITSATCEEAHCEAGNPGDFVYCSGATRRRMNITSSIQRPGAQRCGIVDVDWAELFPED